MEKAEVIKRRYKYRKLIMAGKIKLPIKNAARLIGPDCAYHLYSYFKQTNPDKK
ncbi:MAG: hypothetical protein JW827_03530 [Spirochaetes bacterium]|nr:hypothetical protein [Spirochaetota bacterium]